MASTSNADILKCTLGGEGPSTVHVQERRSAGNNNDDLDTNSIHDLRLESSEKLKRAWESIYDRFQDAHLQAQDEIYLGRRSVKGDKMRIIRDRGHLRGLPRTSFKFGCFYLDEAELIGCKMKEEKDAIKGESMDSAEVKGEDMNSFDEKDDVQRRSAQVSDQAEEPQMKFDPNLEEFLKAEAQRRELLGDLIEDSSEDECDIWEGEDDVFASDSRRKSSSSRQKQLEGGRVEWQDHTSSDSGNEDDVRVLSLAQTPMPAKSPPDNQRSRKKMKLEHGSSLSPIPSSLEESDTPPTSLILSPPPTTISAKKELLSSAETPIRTPISREREINSTRSSIKKQTSARILLPRWEQQQSPVSAIKADMTMSQECTGLTRCTKSLCMLCGAFKRSSKPA